MLFHFQSIMQGKERAEYIKQLSMFGTQLGGDRDGVYVSDDSADQDKYSRAGAGDVTSLHQRRFLKVLDMNVMSNKYH